MQDQRAAPHDARPDEDVGKQLSEALDKLRASRNQYLQAAGTCWSAAFCAIATIDVAGSSEERDARAQDAATFFAAGSQAWINFLDDNLRQLKTCRADSSLELHRLSRTVATFRAALRGDPAANDMLRSHLELLSRLLSVAIPVTMEVAS